MSAGAWAKRTGEVLRAKVASRLSLAGLRSRLLLLVVIAVVPALGLTLYTDAAWRRHDAAGARANALRMARLASAHQASLIEVARDLLVSLAQLPEVRGGDAGGCNELVSALKKGSQRYANLGAIRPDGTVFCGAMPFRESGNAGDRADFRRAVAAREFAVGDFQIGGLTGVATVTLAYPVLDAAGRLRAVVFAALDLNWLGELADEAQMPAGAAVIVIDQSGTILAHHPDSRRWVGQSALKASFFRTLLQHQREGTAEASGLDGRRYLFAFRPLLDFPKGGNVYVAVGIPTAVAFGEANSILARNLIGLGLVAALALAIGRVLGDLVLVRRFRALVGAARRLSVGDLGARTGVAHRSGEIGELAGAFDEMAIALQARQAAADLADAALRGARDELEGRVRERTAALGSANDALQAEVAERRRAEAALAESRAQLSGIIGSAMDAIVAIDEAQRIVLFNAAAEQMFRCPAAEAMGRPVDRFIPERFREAHRDHVRAFGRTGLTRRRVGSEETITGLRGDGEEFPCEAALSQTEVAGRKLYIAVLRDVTERRRAEEELRTSREHLRALALHLEAARETERTRIAREIHDELGQALTGLKLDLSRLAARLPQDQQALREQTGVMVGLVDATIQWVRQLATELRPGVLDDLGLVAALEWQAEEFPVRTGIACRFESDLEELDADPEVSTAVFRICQEALTNVARHAHATQVEIRLEEDGGNVVLAVEDNGRGIAEGEMSGGKSLGLLGMQERGFLLGGKVTIAGRPGEGTTVTVRVPLRRSASSGHGGGGDGRPAPPGGAAP